MPERNHGSIVEKYIISLEPDQTIDFDVRFAHRDACVFHMSTRRATKLALQILDLTLRQGDFSLLDGMPEDQQTIKDQKERITDLEKQLARYSTGDAPQHR